MTSRHLLVLILLVAWIPSQAFAKVASRSEKLPPGSAIERSDEAGLTLNLRFEGDQVRATDEGVYLHLAGCVLESAGEGERVSGAPMLPVWRGIVALPPGHMASMTWRLAATEPLDGRPLPFPTPRAVPQGELSLHDEQLIEDPLAFAVNRAVAVRLGPVRRLRDQRTIEVIVDPVGWDPGRGLSLASEIHVEVRFIPNASARAEAALREPVRRAEKHWDKIYGGALLNAGEARSWGRRVPPAWTGGRGSRAQAALKLLTDTDGLYGLPGDSLVAHGVSLGTPLDQIALFRHRFSWDAEEQPLFEQIAEPRYFVDRNADGLLAADDLLVFPGYRLSHAPDSTDPIEWYGGAAALYVAVDAGLALEMESGSGWGEGGGWALPADFLRRRETEGLESFLANAPPALYDLIEERWESHLYYWPAPRHSDNFTLDLDLPTHGYVAGTEAILGIDLQGTHRHDDTHVLAVSVDNGAFVTDLSDAEVEDIEFVAYVDTLPADALADGVGTLNIATDWNVYWYTMAKRWKLDYRSSYVALDDSLAFHADGLVGPAELRIGGLGGGHESWQLVRVSGAAPRRVALSSDNEPGSPAGELRIRDELAGDEIWWLADESALRMPEVAAPASLDFMDDLSSYDVLVLAADPLADAMTEWLDFREAQGYRIRMLRMSDVWDAFHGGVRGAVGMRNATRFALQQWGAEALVMVGDGSKDAREILDRSAPDLVPVFTKHEDVLGDFELVALEEWFVKYDTYDWPALMVGRLRAGDADELGILIDKIRRYEDYDDPDDDDWRARFLHVADDCWVWSIASNWLFECKDHEKSFEAGQDSILAKIASEAVTGDFEPLPLFISEITDPWFEDWIDTHGGPPHVSDMQASLRPIVSAMFTDSLSKGYGFVTVQSHAHRNQLGHEEYFKTLYGADDQELLENDDRPFVWIVYGCHANNFVMHHEDDITVGDCMGEKLLFLPDGRGAVASYASEGYEYLFPNIHLENHLIELMFRTDAPQVAIYPDWRLGTLQLVSELRHGQFNAAYRYNLLGDPLTRIDRSPPRIRAWIDGREYVEGEFIPVMSPDDTLQVEALMVDESHSGAPAIMDAFRALRSESIPAWAPDHLNASLFDSLLTQTDTLLTDLLVPVDTLAAAAGQGARGWYMSSELYFDPDREHVVIASRDQAGRDGELFLRAPKVVFFISTDGDTLRNGQWVRSADHLELSIHTPSTTYHPADFSLWEDGLLRHDVEAAYADGDTSSTVMEMAMNYQWDAGTHELDVRYEGDSYETLSLVVDHRPRLLDGLIFPNPFRDTVVLRYSLSGGVTRGTLSVYTLSGRRIYRRELADLTEGREHVIAWDGSDQQGDKIANGVYLMRMTFDSDEGQIVWEDKIVRMR